jgi:uncharacterized protein (DUF2267 family)
MSEMSDDETAIRAAINVLRDRIESGHIRRVWR